jgi:hypothetical protein
MYWPYDDVCLVHKSYKCVPSITWGKVFQDGTTINTTGTPVPKKKVLTKGKYRELFCVRRRRKWIFSPAETQQKKLYLKTRLLLLEFNWQYDHICYVPNTCTRIPTLTGGFRYMDNTEDDGDITQPPLTVEEYQRKYCTFNRMLRCYIFNENIIV